MYEYPTIESLAALVFGIVSPDAATSLPTQSKVEEMLAMLKKYSNDFPDHHADPNPLLSTVQLGEVVLITGTTGAIGASVLSQLASSFEVSRIYAFNRKGSKPLLERQKDALVSRGLDVNILVSEKVVLVEGDLTKPDLGLSESLLNQVRSTVCPLAT